MKRKFFLRENNKGVVLILTYVVAGVLIILGAAFMFRSISERILAERNRDSLRALYAAEAGVQKAIYDLRQNPLSAAVGSTLLDGGTAQYSASISASGTTRTIIATGIAANLIREVQATVDIGLPNSFWGNGVYVAGEFETNGNSYSVNGLVAYGSEAESQNNFATVCNNGDCGAQNVTNTAASSLPKLNFAAIKTLAQGQGNYYDAARIAAVTNGQDSYPINFWNDAPNNTIANIIYVEGDLALNGNVSAGGFFVVAGNVLTDPNATADTQLNGSGTIEGLIYTTGEFKINGGGGGLNVNGGVWAGSEAELQGNSAVTYNSVYQAAVKTKLQTEGIENTGITVSAWKEKT